MGSTKINQDKPDRRGLPALNTSELLESKTSPIGLAEYEQLAPAPPPPDYPGQRDHRELARPPMHPAHSSPYSSNDPPVQEAFVKHAERCDHRESRKYGALGIIAGVFLFPVGLICTRLDSRLVCKRCGATLYKTPAGWYTEQNYGVAQYSDARGR